ncbi:Uncharacterized protein PCOAH_00039100 [Plasmodium coatneyi]|uniref:Uncharacterized protein n=1 Tax=Plasmodium coatneyi TaxID=208452 RepID=A0A1B1E320_9APIC|nr:Uncharacterized protein PCOAH_00039100 [Plasmodium coatneyi]ANQ09414.1 Uncharacterized protein PCOAH_00039100 [Plasmodium coatneyi]
MLRTQSSTEKNFHTNANFDSTLDVNTYNDASINSNFSMGGNSLPRILKMYTRELQCSSEEQKSDGSHLRSENLFPQRNDHVSENTCLTSILHLSDVITSQSENCARLNGEHLNCYHSSVNSNASRIESGVPSYLASSLLAKFCCTEIPIHEEGETVNCKTEPNYAKTDEAVISTNGQNNGEENNTQFGTPKNRTNDEIKNKQANDSLTEKDHLAAVGTSSIYLPINENSEDGQYLYDSKKHGHGESLRSSKRYALSSPTGDPKTTNMYRISHPTVVPTPECSAYSNGCPEEERGQDKLQPEDGHMKERMMVYYPDEEMQGGKRTFSTKLSALNDDNFELKQISCNTQPHGIERKKQHGSEKICYSTEEKKDPSASPLSMKPRSYSLDDIRKGKIKIPNVIFTKLPFNSNGDNVIDSYRRNHKLLNFMKDCNESVGLILKYPQIEKSQNRTFKVPSEISPAIRSNIGSAIIYEDKFDRRNYHPQVQNLHMGKIYESHVLNILKNKKDLGKKLFNRSNTYEKYKYNNSNGFWISNIDKRRLVDPEKNDSYVTELIYEKNGSYAEEMETLKRCRGYDGIPPIAEFYKDNNFYLFLQKEGISRDYLIPVMATTMRRYDIEKVAEYEYVQTRECITPVHCS